MKDILICLAAARRGEDLDMTVTHTMGHRAGCRSGYLARGGRVYRVGPAGHDGAPYGERERDAMDLAESEERIALNPGTPVEDVMRRFM